MKIAVYMMVFAYAVVLFTAAWDAVHAIISLFS
jgi:hypothetical protein